MPCTSDTTFNVVVKPVPKSNIQLSGAAQFCLGDSVILTSDTAMGNTWSIDGTFNSNNQGITATSAGLYTLEVTNNGCSSFDEVQISTITPIKPALIYIGDSLVSTQALSYQWFLNGIILNGDTIESLKPTITGNYSVVTVDSNGCSSESDDYFIEVTTIPGIASEKRLPEFKAFPNPFVDELTVEFSGDFTDISEVVLTDVNGRIAVTQSVNSSLTTVNREALTSGIYTLGFRLNNGTYLNSGQKLVIK